MTYSPEYHHRRSIRLRGYDYAEPAMYFVTLCTQNRIQAFGEIVGGTMMPTLAGVMIEQWWNQLPERFPCLGLDEFVLMPNHIHGIIAVGMNGEETSDGSPLSRVVQWLKSITTTDYRRGVIELDWSPFNRRLWQRNYYEHIIRSDAALDRIRGYIEANPANWESDEENLAAFSVNHNHENI